MTTNRRKSNVVAGCGVWSLRKNGDHTGDHMTTNDGVGVGCVCG